MTILNWQKLPQFSPKNGAIYHRLNVAQLAQGAFDAR
jgi:hypothetical protein